MRKTWRWTLGVTLAAALTLGTGGAALADPEAESGCMGHLSRMFGSNGTRDDIALLHNDFYKSVGSTPGQGYQSGVHLSGDLTDCLKVLPPGLVIPPHP